MSLILFGLIFCRDHSQVTAAKVPYSSGTTHIVKQEVDTSNYTVFGEGSGDDLDIYDQPEHKLYMRSSPYLGDFSFC